MRQDIIEAIKRREVAIRNDDKDALIKCVEHIWHKANLPNGVYRYYYQNSFNDDVYNCDDLLPDKMDYVKASELWHFIEDQIVEVEYEETNEPTKQPATASNPIKPKHYKQPDPFEISEIYGLNAPTGDAIKYILRAGTKENNPYIQDLEKAVKCLQREIELSKKYRNGGKK